MPQYQGVWSLQSAAQLQSTQRWVTDPLFDYNTLLLQADSDVTATQNNTFLDSSSNAFAITRNGNTTQGSFTPFSQVSGAWSNYFGSNTSNLKFASNAVFAAGTGNFTVECFATFDAWASTNQRLFVQGSSGTDNLTIQRDSGANNLLVNIQGAQPISYAWFPVPGRWYHIALVRSGTGTGQLVLYIDGISVATGTSSASIAQNQVLIGGIDWASGYNHQGNISNLRYTVGAALYTANFTPPVTPLTTTSQGATASQVEILTCQDNRFIDNSSNSFSITVNGTTSVQAFSPFAPQFQWTPSVIGGSGYFDGTGDYLTVANNTAFTLTGDGTIEAWFYVPTTPSTYAMIASKWGAGGGSEFILEYGTRGGSNARQIRFFWAPFSAGSAFLTSPNDAFAIGAWNHVAVCRSGTGSNNWTMYINGQVSVQGTNTTGATNNGAQLAIGAYSADGSTPITGYLTTFRMVKGTAVYTGAFTPPTRPLSDSGAASAAAYPSTTNVNTSFAASNTSLLLNFTNAGIYDGTMKNNLETVGNAQISTAVVKYGSGSLAFDGSGDYLVVGNMSTTPNLALLAGDFTIEYWYYPLNTSIHATLNNLDDNAGTGSLWILMNGTFSGGSKVQFGYNTGSISNILFGTGTFAINQWYHIAITRQGPAMRCFINGIQEGATNTGIGTGSIQAFNRNLVIGATLSAGSYTAYNLNGYLDDFRLTKGIARYTQNFIPPSVALPRQ